eukprot:CAMPEP_0194565390 /NCGR_PEP_ID=MMETSP0292-20121207/4677_1 /TAXON_ID=39354 /ORGANISM="Heterosigma akashiwo, Strain CCMP2393" /LENGTH=111 /DNA_ID=CAMNT_0039414735 /DNA_START=229 /DNA_END=564 /DNA_ORIENTATION=+
MAPILITGNNINITPSTRSYIEKKFRNVLGKLGGDVTKVDCHLTVDKNPRIADSHRAEVTVYGKGGVIRASQKSEHIYSTIDLLSDTMKRSLREQKEKKVHSQHRDGFLEY